MTIKIGKPREISPALIEIGDEIEVQFPEKNGIVQKLRGIVGKRITTGRTRFYMTKEGSTLFSFEPGVKTGLKITLYGRAEVIQETLFSEINWDFRDEVNKRIA